MIKALILSLCIIFGLGCDVEVPSKSVLSWNIRCDCDEGKENDWLIRKSYVQDYILEKSPTYLTLQEVSSERQHQDLLSILPNYDIFWDQRSGVLVGYDTTVVAETPLVSFISLPSAPYPRVAAVMEFENLLFVGIHAGVVGSLENDVFRTEMTKTGEVLLTINQHNKPIIITGDFNHLAFREDEFPVDERAPWLEMAKTPLYSMLLDSGLADNRCPGKTNTTRSFDPARDELDFPWLEARIDWLLTANGASLSNPECVDLFREDGLRVSDHLPLTATLNESR